MPRDREFLPDLQEGFRPRQPRTERGQFHPTLTRREPLGNGSPGCWRESTYRSDGVVGENNVNTFQRLAVKLVVRSRPWPHRRPMLLGSLAGKVIPIVYPEPGAKFAVGCERYPEGAIPTEIKERPEGTKIDELTFWSI